MTDEIVLTGPRGDNPLGFLTALGTVVVLQDAGRHSKLRWDGLTPIVLIDVQKDGGKESFVDCIFQQLKKEAVKAIKDQEPDPVLVPGEKNVKFGIEKYESFVESARQRFFKGGDWSQRRCLDMASFYGVFPRLKEADQERIQANFWIMLEGSGHQHFFETARNLMLSVNKKHLEKALFGPWSLEDDRLSLRLDPIEDRRYALMDVDPSSLGTKTLWGANRLAFEAFRLFPAVPAVGVGRGVVGWKADHSKGPRVRWPLWRLPVGMEVIRSVLSHPKMWQEDWGGLRAMGVSAVIEARMIKIDRYKSMAVGTPLWVEQ